MSKKYRSQMPKNPEQRARIERLDAAAKQNNTAHHRNQPTTAQRAARSAPHTAAVRQTIRNGKNQPRTWDEINSTRSGGRDFM